MESAMEEEWATDVYHVHVLNGALAGRELIIDEIDAGSHAAVLSEVVAGMLAEHPAHANIDGACVEIRIHDVVANPLRVIPVTSRQHVQAVVVEFDAREVIGNLEDRELAETLLELSQYRLELAVGEETWETTAEFRQILSCLVALQKQDCCVEWESLVHLIKLTSHKRHMSPAWALDSFRDHVTRCLAAFVVTLETRPPRVFHIDDLEEESPGSCIRDKVASLLDLHPSRLSLTARGIEIDYQHSLPAEVRHHVKAEVQSPDSALNVRLSKVQGARLRSLLEDLSHRQTSGGECWASTSDFSSIVESILSLQGGVLTRGSARAGADCDDEIAQVIMESASKPHATAKSVLDALSEEFG